MKTQIKTFTRQGSGYAFSDGVYAEFRDEAGVDRYEPVDDTNLESELGRLRSHFGELQDLRLEQLVTE